MAGVGLVALTVIAPQLLATRELSRQTQCQANLKSIVDRMRDTAIRDQGAVPPLVAADVSWVTRLHREQPGDDKGDSVNRRAVLSWICPASPRSGTLDEQLNYAANGGWGEFAEDSAGQISEPRPLTTAQDWNGDGQVSAGERLRSRATGVVWRHEAGRPAWKLNEIQACDGSEHTYLLAESLNAGPRDSTATLGLAFVFNRLRLRPGDAGRPFALEAESLGPFAINAQPPGRAGRSGAPSSSHGRIAYFAFCSGAIRPISEQIDPYIYLFLMAPNDDEIRVE